jgi:hypothetical protein
MRFTPEAIAELMTRIHETRVSRVLETPSLEQLPFTPAQAADYLSKHWREQMAVIRAAPLPFLASVGIIAGLTAFLVWLHLQGRLATMEERLKLKDDQLDDARQRMGDQRVRHR